MRHLPADTWGPALPMGGQPRHLRSRSPVSPRLAGAGPLWAPPGGSGSFASGSRSAAGSAVTSRPGAPPLPALPDLAAAWPLLDFLELGPFPGAVPCARRHVQNVLTEWRQQLCLDPARLIVSELVTNSVAASGRLRHPSPVRLWLASDLTRLLIAVADPSPDPPVPADPDPGAEEGRGLLLVRAVSDRWGWLAWTDGGMAKAVWAELAAPGAADAAGGGG